MLETQTISWYNPRYSLKIFCEQGGRLPLFHFDLYRLGCADELFDIGWEDYLARGGVCAVEWSERMEELLEPGTIRVDLRRGEDESRRVITVEGVSL